MGAHDRLNKTTSDHDAGRAGMPDTNIHPRNSLINRHLSSQIDILPFVGDK
jgi:hypothetical protein